MPDLLLELFSEEIPARMQTQAAADLRKLVTDALVERGLLYEGAASFATPRRLALHVAGLPARQPDTREEKKGPRVGAPDAALQGFLKSAGLSSIEQATIQKDPKKGDFYVAVIERAGAETIDILAEIIPATIRNFPWPKSMCWGANSLRPDALRWVRPLHSILATFGPETEAPDIVRFCGERHHVGRRDQGPSLHGAGEDPGEALRRLCSRARARQGRARRRAPARDHSGGRQELSRWRKGWSSSRTPDFWKRSRASSNGPSR